MANVQVAANDDRLVFVELSDVSIKCGVPFQTLAESLQSLSGVYDVSCDQKELLVLGGDETFGIGEFCVWQIVRDVHRLNFRVNRHSIVPLSYVPVRVITLQNEFLWDVGFLAELDLLKRRKRLKT